jgi:hypothetical protein
MINNCDHELVIIVPYIKMTDEIFSALKQANSRGVETTLVYREKKVNQQELDQLHQLDNINILHHPNVHCKCYYDGKNVIIGSLNLYDYSIENNREMGFLVDVKSIVRQGNDAKPLNYSLHNEGKINDTDTFLSEIQSIFNGSTIEKKSTDTVKEGFNIDVLHTSKQKSQQLAKDLTAVFLNKKFESFPINDTYKERCRNFFDKVDVIYEGHRFLIEMPLSQEQIEEIFAEDKTLYLQSNKGLKFKTYFNSYSSSATLYLDRSNKVTQKASEMNDEGYVEAFKTGLELFFQLYQQRLKNRRF